MVDYVTDLSSHKQGLYLPGSLIPIVQPDKIRETKPDYIIIVPWNLKEEIMEQLQYVREWGCRFLTLVPDVVEHWRWEVKDGAHSDKRGNRVYRDSPNWKIEGRIWNTCICQSGKWYFKAEKPNLSQLYYYYWPGGYLRKSKRVSAELLHKSCGKVYCRTYAEKSWWFAGKQLYITYNASWRGLSGRM